MDLRSSRLCQVLCIDKLHMSTQNLGDMTWAITPRPATLLAFGRTICVIRSSRSIATREPYDDGTPGADCVLVLGIWGF